MYENVKFPLLCWIRVMMTDEKFVVVVVVADDEGSDARSCEDCWLSSKKLTVRKLCAGPKLQRIACIFKHTLDCMMLDNRPSAKE